MSFSFIKIPPRIFLFSRPKYVATFIPILAVTGMVILPSFVWIPFRHAPFSAAGGARILDRRSPL